MESAGGIVLMAATALALIAANSGAAGLYALFIETPLKVFLVSLAIFDDLGSLLSGIMGYLVLHLTLPKAKA